MGPFSADMSVDGEVEIYYLNIKLISNLSLGDF